MGPHPYLIGFCLFWGGACTIALPIVLAEYYFAPRFAERVARLTRQQHHLHHSRHPARRVDFLQRGTR